MESGFLVYHAVSLLPAGFSSTALLFFPATLPEFDSYFHRIGTWILNTQVLFVETIGHSVGHRHIMVLLIGFYTVL